MDSTRFEIAEIVGARILYRAPTPDDRPGARGSFVTRDDRGVIVALGSREARDDYAMIVALGEPATVAASTDDETGAECLACIDPLAPGASHTCWGWV